MDENLLTTTNNPSVVTTTNDVDPDGPTLAPGVTEEGITLANAGTPEQVQQTPFNVPVDQNIPLSVLSTSTTFDDVRAAADLRRTQEEKSTQLDESDLSAVPTFDDPEATIRSYLYGDAGPSAIEQDIAGLRGEVSETIGGIDENLTRTRERAERRTDLTERERALASTNEKIAQRQTRFRREMRAFETDAEKRGADRQFVQSERAKLEADATAELADLYIIQNAQLGNVETARDYIDTAVNNRYRSIEIEIAQRKAEIEERLPLLEKEEKKRQEQYLFALNEREQGLAAEKEEARNKRSYMLEVASIGGSDALQRQIMSAPTEDQAALLTSQFIGRQMRSKAAAAAAAAAAAGQKPPTIKNINGVDYQWNEELGVWEIPTGVETVSQDQVDNSVANLDFLLDTTDRVIGAKLSSATGDEVKYDALWKGSAQSPVSRGIGTVFTGTNRQRRLEAQVDTLRANMLTLATDPSIKEFFGPQMSDADVKLMTAAGTTLRPGSQSDQELYDEAVRIQDFLLRARTAVLDGSRNTPANTITAPDGTRVQIID